MKDFEKVIDFGNLYKAYKKSRKGKGHNGSSMKFRISALDSIYQIKKDLESKSYQVSPYNSFKIYDPKEREIKSCTFVDKIVQHCVCDNVLLPNFSKIFILDSFAGQIGKGTLFGLDRLKLHMEQAFQKYGYNCWILKCDIKKFFYNIDHNILKDILRYHIEDDDIYWLCEVYVNSTEGLGIPLGNQISQVFALLYLSLVDNLIKEELGVEFYGRYMDDFYLIVNSKEYAKYCLYCIQEFVDSLHLQMNDKTQIIPFKNGIKFCGFHTYVTKEGIVIRKFTNENKREAKKKYRKMARLVNKGKLSEENFYESYNSWKEYALHGNCIKFVNSMDIMIKSILNKEDKIMSSIEERYLSITKIITEGQDSRSEDFRNLITHLEENTEWLKSPASTRYHCSYEGGLVEHSTYVAELAIRFKKLLAPEVSVESAAFCGLMHDIGKVGLYVQKEPTEKQIQYGYPGSIVYNEGVLDSSHHEYRSLKMIGEFVRLTQEEYEAIQYHNSPWNKNIECAFYQNKLMTILQMADYWSTVYMEKGGAK